MKITKTFALEKIANKIRMDTLQEIYYAKSGHPGGSLSIAEILTVLYFNEMHIDENKPDDENRDRFVLSKGHASAALYATLAEKGYFPKEELLTFRNISSYLQGHPDMKNTPGVDMSTGSLGQGLSAASGMALSSKMDEKGYRVFCLLGDGELEEGQIWEAAMFASKFKLDNLVVIVDSNNLQLTGTTDEIMDLNTEDIANKFKAFGFNTSIIDGNNVDSLIDTFTKAELVKEKPTAIIAKTVKGKGVSFMENKQEWHGKAPNDEEYKKAIDELIARNKEIDKEAMTDIDSLDKKENTDLSM
jgi:transketolase